MGKQVVLVYYCTTTPNTHQTPARQPDTTVICNLKRKERKNLLASSYGDSFFKVDFKAVTVTAKVPLTEIGNYTSESKTLNYYPPGNKEGNLNTTTYTGRNQRRIFCFTAVIHQSGGRAEDGGAEKLE